MPDPDPIKDYLIQQRNFACGILGIVNGRPGPIPEAGEREKIAVAMRDAGKIADTILNGPTSPMFTKSETWLMWAPLDLADKDLMAAAVDGCAQAQKALDLYCASLPEESAAPVTESEKEKLLRKAAKAVWKCRTLFCCIIECAGVKTIPAP